MRGPIDHILAIALLGTLGIVSLTRAPAPTTAAPLPAHDAPDVPGSATSAPAKTPPGNRRAATLVRGEATFYADDFHGQTMANGRRFDMYDPTITASNRWPLGTVLRVRRLPGCPWYATLSDEERETYRTRAITVTVSDRGNFSHELDLSLAAFAQIGRVDEGRLLVSIEVIDKDDG